MPRIPVIATDSPSPSPRQSPIVYQLPTRASLESRENRPFRRSYAARTIERGARPCARRRLAAVAVGGAPCSSAPGDSRQRKEEPQTGGHGYEGARASRPRERFVRGRPTTTTQRRARFVLFAGRCDGTVQQAHIHFGTAASTADVRLGDILVLAGDQPARRCPSVRRQREVAGLRDRLARAGQSRIAGG